MKKDKLKSIRMQHDKPLKLKLVDVADIEDPECFVLYGRSGTGKTTFAATFPKPILYIDIKDRGTKSIKGVKGIKVLQLKSWEQFEEAYWYLKENEGKFKTVVIDTASQLQQMLVREHCEDKPKKSDKRPGDWGSMTQSDWGQVGGMLNEWLENFRDLPLNTVIIAQDKVFTVDEGGESGDGLIEPEVGPHLMKSVAKSVNANASVIANTFIRERKIKKEVNGKKITKYKIEYCLRVGPSSVYTTKVRKDKDIILPPVIVDPSYDEVIDIIEGE